MDLGKARISQVVPFLGVGVSGALWSQAGRHLGKLLRTLQASLFGARQKEKDSAGNRYSLFLSVRSLGTMKKVQVVFTSTETESPVHALGVIHSFPARWAWPVRMMGVPQKGEAGSRGRSPHRMEPPGAEPFTRTSV